MHVALNPFEPNSLEEEDMSMTQMHSLSLLKRSLEHKEFRATAPKGDLSCWTEAVVWADPDKNRLHLQFLVYFQKHGRGRPLLSKPIAIDHDSFKGETLMSSIMNTAEQVFERQYSSMRTQSSTTA